MLTVTKINGRPILPFLEGQTQFLTLFDALVECKFRQVNHIHVDGIDEDTGITIVSVEGGFTVQELWRDLDSPFWKTRQTV